MPMRKIMKGDMPVLYKVLAQMKKMNVYDTANQLAGEIRESEEYKGYKKLKDTLMSNPETKKKIEDFEKLRYEIQLMQYTGEDKDEEKKSKTTRNVQLTSAR